MSSAQTCRLAIAAGATLFAAIAFAEASRAAERVAEPLDVATIRLIPSAIALDDARSRQRVAVMATDRFGDEYDVTSQAHLEVASGEARVDANHVVVPQQAGRTKLIARFGALTVESPITVGELSATPPASFTNEVMAVLGKAGCNAGPCHGHASGKGGFKLSLRGYDSAADHEALFRREFGRRIDLQFPERSLLLRKPTGELPHGGGNRLVGGADGAALLTQWIAEGAPSDVGRAPKLDRIEVTPGDRLFARPGLTQQLVVRAHFTDGRVRDVTSRAIYELTNDVGIARVDEQGKITALREGETAVLVRFLGKMTLSRVLVVNRMPNFVWNGPPPRNFVDAHVYRKLRAIEVVPSPATTDAEFLRRVSIDVVGVPPTVDEVADFLADQDPNKRAKWIDRLLADDRFGEQWALYWLELSGATESGASVGRSGMWALYHWLCDSFNRNVSFDRFVRSIVAGKGSVIGEPNSAFSLRIPRVEAIPQALLGMRVQCAQCHDHPFDVWTQSDYNSLATFFTNVKMKDGPRFYIDNQTFVAPDSYLPWNRTKRTTLRRLDGSSVEVGATTDYRDALADWMLGDAKSWTARAIANRAWGRLMGRGIVEPVDDMRFSNPPVNEPLLAALADDFLAHRYDFKHLLRTILNSHTYQASSTANESNAADTMNFSHAALRRLTAEQLLDAISATTGITDEIPGAPAGMRAAQWAPLNTRSRFLETFGRPVRRATACTCERAMETTLPQSLHLMNGQTIETKLRDPQGAVQKIIAGEGTDAAKIDALYLRLLARHPTPAEIRTAERYLAGSNVRGEAAIDLAWALLNSQEFLFNH
jgi:hypothetical protein